MPSLHVTVTQDHHDRAEEVRHRPYGPGLSRCENCDISQALKDLGYRHPVTDDLGVIPDNDLPYVHLPKVARQLVARADQGLPVEFPVEFDLEWTDL